MFRRMSVRLRLTALSVLLLSVCCVGLTVILNFSANRMANVIEAVAVTPAMNISDETEKALPLQPILDTAAPSLSTQRAKKDFSNQSILYMILVVTAGGALSYYISGKALKPLRILSEQMNDRTVHNLSENLPVPQSGDEIAALTESFNSMTDKLGEAFAVQKRFSQSAAHELRTPLTVLKTKVDVFKKKEEHTAEEYDKLLEIITTHTNRLSSLVKDLLELTNMDALPENETFKVKSLIEGIAEELSPLGKKKSIAIAVSGEDVALCGNKNLIHRAFYNVIENAIKYNQESGSVEVTVSRENNRIKISVKDSGIGIPAEMREQIFEPFFRVDKSRSRQMGGAGLGMSTAKAVVENHGGTIEVFENPVGGTIFEITI